MWISAGQRADKKILDSVSVVILTVGTLSRCTDWKFQFGTVFGGDGIVLSTLNHLPLSDFFKIERFFRIEWYLCLKDETIKWKLYIATIQCHIWDIASMIVSFKISFDSINQLRAIISQIITYINSKSIYSVNEIISNEFNNYVVNFKISGASFFWIKIQVL